MCIYNFPRGYSDKNIRPSKYSEFPVSKMHVEYRVLLPKELFYEYMKTTNFIARKTTPFVFARLCVCLDVVVKVFDMNACSMRTTCITLLAISKIFLASYSLKVTLVLFKFRKFILFNIVNVIVSSKPSNILLSHRLLKLQSPTFL